ncbi:MAG: PAS domain-containing protein [Ruminococcus sp.]|nr:PAS domain-containing protein [Ruminococcus sp.]
MIDMFLKSVIDSDTAAVVICDTEHRIVYMNPAAVSRYARSGGSGLVGKSLLECHNSQSGEKIIQIIEWFKKDKSNNRVFTFHNTKENKDVYMIALRDGDGRLIGYYEKHEYRTPESGKLYDIGGIL